MLYCCCGLEQVDSPVTLDPDDGTLEDKLYVSNYILLLAIYVDVSWNIMKLLILLLGGVVIKSFLVLFLSLFVLDL